MAVEEMGGPKIGFHSGRTDALAPSTPDKDSRFSPDGRLPDGDKVCDSPAACDLDSDLAPCRVVQGSNDATIKHVRDVFSRMGFNDRDAVALCGAHAVGRCHTDRSG